MQDRIRKKFKFVVVKAMNEIFNYDEVRDIMPKIFEFKTEGYRAEYPDEVLPYDTSDFISSHILLCEDGSRGLVPVMGFKSVTLEKCHKHRINFPVFGMLNPEDESKITKQTLEEIVNSYLFTNSSTKLAYNGSFTVSPSIRKDKDLMKHFWDIGFSMFANYYIDEKIDHTLAVCATKFNVHKKKQEMGWNFIMKDGVQLPEYECPSLFGAKLIPMEITDISVKCKEQSKKFKQMWEERIIIDLSHLQKKDEAA